MLNPTFFLPEYVLIGFRGLSPGGHQAQIDLEKAGHGSSGMALVSEEIP